MCSIAGVALEEQKRCHDLRGNRTPNLRVWNPTRCHCAMKSNSGAVRASESISKMKRDAATCGIAVLAERLRRTLKARVRKSVGSIPTDCKQQSPHFFLFVPPSGRGVGVYSVDIHVHLRRQRGSRLAGRWHVHRRPRIAQLAERETVDGYN